MRLQYLIIHMCIYVFIIASISDYKKKSEFGNTHPFRMKQYKLYSVTMRSKILVSKLRFVVLEQKYKIEDVVMGCMPTRLQFDNCT